MGKGFNNYMCKKFFHPASRDNLKRVWMAEQQAEAYKKKQEELRTQYEKEQNLHENKAMLSKESKDKLSVNFMYEPPPGVRKERDKDTAEPEYKFEWQRKFNAPRESYCKGDTEIRDQPFGIQVRNVRCIKCHKWGHINTDKECSMYSISMSEARKLHSEAEAGEMMAKNVLEEQMKEDGLVMKRSAMELQNIKHISQQHKLVPSEDESDMVNGKNQAEGESNTEIAFLKSLSKEQKLELLKKLEKIERLKKKKQKSRSKKSKKTKREKEKKSRHKKSRKSKKSSSDTSSDSSSSSESNDSAFEKKESSANRNSKSEKSRGNRNSNRSRSRSKSRASKVENGHRDMQSKEVYRQSSPWDKSRQHTNGHKSRHRDEDVINSSRSNNVYKDDRYHDTRDTARRLEDNGTENKSSRRREDSYAGDNYRNRSRSREIRRERSDKYGNNHRDHSDSKDDHKRRRSRSHSCSRNRRH